MVIRIPVIPGFNDELNQITAIGEFASDLGVSELHLLPYHRYGLAKYASLGHPYTLPRPAPTSIANGFLRQELEALGLHVLIGG